MDQPDFAPGDPRPDAAERVLREERALYRDLVESHPRGIYRLRSRAPAPVTPEAWPSAADHTYTVEFASERFAAILGIDVPRLRARPGSVSELVVPDDRPGFNAANARALNAREPFHWEGRLAVGREIRRIRFESVPRVLENGDCLWTGTVEDVTGQRLAESRLRESEGRFRSFFETPLIGACITAPDKGWLAVNGRLCRMLGYSRAEFETLTWTELTHPDDLEKDLDRFDRVVRGEIDGYTLEKRFLRKDGSVVPVELSVSCVRTEAGAVDYFFALLQDITERRRTEEELRAYREGLEELVATRTAEAARHEQLLAESSHLARVGGWDFDVRTNDLSWTDVLYDIHEVEPGYRPNVADGIGFYAPEARPVISTAFGRAVREGEPYDLELQLVTAKGRRRWVRAIGRAHFEAGEVVRVGGVFQDIDARKRAEEDLRLYQARLEELVAERTADLEKSRARLVEAQAVAHLGSWEWDVLRDEITGSAEFFRLFGVPPEGIANLEHFYSLLHPDDREEVRRAVAEAMTRPQPELLRTSYRVPLADGTCRYIGARAIFSLDPAGRLERVLGTCLDLTELRKTEEELRAYRGRLEELVQARTSELEAANRELESFSYSVSHDLRAPLRALDGFSAVLLEECGEGLDEKGRGYLDRIRSASIRMAHLIDGLLSLARLTRRDLSLAPVDLGALARDVAAELLALDPGRAVRLLVADGMTVEGDPRLLRVLLANLIGNSLKFTSTRPDAEVEVGCAERDGEKTYFVKDNGVGFDMKYAAKLFTPFQRLHGTDEFPGTGIGLATVQRIVARHGGRVWPEAGAGKGATFYFTLGVPAG